MRRMLLSNFLFGTVLPVACVFSIASAEVATCQGSDKCESVVSAPVPIERPKKHGVQPNPQTRDLSQLLDDDLSVVDDFTRQHLFTRQSISASGSALANTKLEFQILQLPLVSFLETIAMESGLRLTISDKVKGNIVDLHIQGSGPEILDQITQENELDWFEYNGIIYVSAAKEAITRIVPLDDIDLKRGRRALIESGLIMDATLVSDAADGAALSIYGSPEFVGIAEAIIKVTPPLDALRPSRLAIRVRKGTDTAMEYYGEAGRLVENQTNVFRAAAEKALTSRSLSTSIIEDQNEAQSDE